jgi:hypothetical protein
MLKQWLITCAVAAGVAIGLPAAGQESQTQSQQATMVHVEGCVFPQRALTASKAVLMPAGSTDAYFLTNINVIAAPGDGIDDKSVFKLDRVAQERLRALIGKRVGVTGRIERSADPLFRVTSIREIVGICPVTPGTT